MWCARFTESQIETLKALIRIQGDVGADLEGALEALELLDFIGLDVADAIGEAIHADTGDPSHRPPGRIKQLVGDGRLGRKSGRGFYGYE